MEIKAEKVKPYDNNRGKTEQVRDMFDSIAPAYDFMNRAMTFGLDKWWRSIAVKSIVKRSPSAILDVATGTGDVAIALAKALPSAHVTGIDLSEEMIRVGREKITHAGFQDRVEMSTGDCMALPMADETFDCITVAYGVRNFEHLLQGYREMYRVLRPGGMLCVIELSTPTSGMVKPFYSLYTRHVIPLVGRMVSKDVRAYSYLPESIAAVPQGREMLSLMREAGFNSTSLRTLTFGVCAIYTALRD